jgi:DNA-binding MarR family transcriptional regulator
MKTLRPSLPQPDPDAQAVSELALAVFRLNGALLRYGDELVEPVGLSSARWQMLGAIALAGRPLSAPQIGNAMGVSRQGAQKQLNLLVGQGLVETRPNPAHRRSPLHALTPRGRAAYERVDALWTVRAADLAHAVPVARVRNATATLGSLLRALEALAPAAESQP